MLFSSASTSEGARAHTGTHNGYACLPRSVTYAKVRSLTFQPTVAVLRTCLRPRPAAPIRTTLRPRPYLGEQMILPLHVAVLRTGLRPRSAAPICTTLRPRPYLGKQMIFLYMLPFFAPVCALARLSQSVPLCALALLDKCALCHCKSLRPRGEGVGECRRMRGQKQTTHCNVRLWSGGTLPGDSSTDARNDMF